MSYSDQHTNKEGDFFFGSKTPTLNIPSFDALAEMAKKLKVIEGFEQKENDEFRKFKTFFGDLKAIQFVSSEPVDFEEHDRNYTFVATIYEKEVSFVLSDVAEYAGMQVFYLEDTEYSVDIGFEDFAKKLLPIITFGAHGDAFVDAGLLNDPNSNQLNLACRDAWSVLSKLKERST